MFEAIQFENIRAMWMREGTSKNRFFLGFVAAAQRVCADTLCSAHKLLEGTLFGRNRADVFHIQGASLS